MNSSSRSKIRNSIAGVLAAPLVLANAALAAGNYTLLKSSGSSADICAALS